MEIGRQAEGQSRLLFLARGAWAATVLLLAGCASQGPLRPPTLSIPRPVEALNAHRFGSNVQLTFIVPDRTTDGDLLARAHSKAGPLTVDICRAESNGTATQQPCVMIAHLPVHAGQAVQWNEALPPALLDGKGRALVYRVLLKNGRGRSGEVRSATTAAGPAPHTVRQLTAKGAPGGVALMWLPADAIPGEAIHIRVVRTFPAKGGKPSRSVTENLAIPAPSPGKAETGVLDPGAAEGSTDAYTVFRSRTIPEAGRAVSIDSVPAMVTVAGVRNQTAPPAPTGLAAVANSTVAGKPEIDLVWNPVSSPEIAGYVVYRSVDGATPRKLSASPVTGFTFADTSVQSGQEYRYRVSALGRNGMESAPSAPASETVR